MQRLVEEKLAPAAEKRPALTPRTVEELDDRNEPEAADPIDLQVSHGKQRLNNAATLIAIA